MDLTGKSFINMLPGLRVPRGQLVYLVGMQERLRPPLERLINALSDLIASSPYTARQLESPLGALFSATFFSMALYVLRKHVTVNRWIALRNVPTLTSNSVLVL